MNKKRYEAPTVKKVRLEVKNAVLGVCNTSYAQLTPYDGITTCYLNPLCVS